MIKKNKTNADKKISAISFIFLFLLSFSNSDIISNSLDKRIELFKSYSKINKDRTINIKEQITYFFPSSQHGITMFFPARYEDNIGNIYNIKFKVNSILRDNKPEKYKISESIGYKIVNIGSVDKLISGRHVYEIDYITDHQLYFPNVKESPNIEFYFQAIPAQHKNDIEKAIIEVELPQEINTKDIKFIGYFGTIKPKNENYIASINSQNIIKFELTEILKANERFSIVITWPQFPSVIEIPSNIKKIKRFLFDNIHIFILLLGAIVLLAYYVIMIIRVKSKTTKRSIIPLFYPPGDMLPSAVGCLYNYNYNSGAILNKLFAAEIVNMAVNNLITINYKKGSFLSSAVYTLVKNEDINKNLSKKVIAKEHQDLLDILFSKANSVKINSQNNSILIKTLSSLSQYLKIYYADKYFDYHLGSVLTGIIFSFIIVLISLYFNITIITIAFVILYIIMIIIFTYLVRGYTQEGQNLLEKIKGFRLFLSTTEGERLKIIGTPPEKTPELYEKYLPYAIVFNVEKAWSKNFVTVFNQIQDYKPTWINANFDVLNAIRFYSDLNYSLISSIASIHTPIIGSFGNAIKNMPIPGSISGLKDKGQSGGGGGGGIDTW